MEHYMETGITRDFEFKALVSEQRERERERERGLQERGDYPISLRKPPVELQFQFHFPCSFEFEVPLLV